MKISYEFYPPKDLDYKKVVNEYSLISSYGPSFISITYGAMGGSQEKSFGLIKAKRIYSDKQITKSITNRGYDPNNFSSSFQQIKKLPAKHKVGNSLQPRSTQIAKALNRIKNMRRSTTLDELVSSNICLIRFASLVVLSFNISSKKGFSS